MIKVRLWKCVGKRVEDRCNLRDAAGDDNKTMIFTKTVAGQIAQCIQQGMSEGWCQKDNRLKEQI